jgi:gliding motility-associated-like protein
MIYIHMLMKKPVLLLMGVLFCPLVFFGQVSISGPTVLCPGDCATLTANVSPNTPPPQAYTWSTGDTTQSIFICEDSTFSPAFYCVSVTFGVGGQPFLDTACIWISSAQSLPVRILSTSSALCPDSIGQCERVCPNTTVTYYLPASIPGGSLLNANWTVNGSIDFSVSPDGRSVTVNWGQPGAGSVSVVASAGNQCVGEDAVCINIVDEPRARFSTVPVLTGDTLTLCVSQQVSFNNQSLYADNFQWFFSDDNSISGTANPEHLYAVPGLFEVILVASSTCSCTDTLRRYVRVLPTDPVALDCIGTVCPGEVVTYTATTNCPISSWAVVNGSILGGGSPGVDTVTVQWTQGPAGFVSYTLQPCASSSCPLPLLFSIPVIDDSPEIAGPQAVCTNERSSYRIQPFAGTEYRWTLSGGGSIIAGQGTNEIVIEWGSFANPNQARWVVVEYDNCYLGCGGVDSLDVRVRPFFVVDGPARLCEGAQGSFAARQVPSGGNLACNWRLFSPSGAVLLSTSVPVPTLNLVFNAGPGTYRLLAVAATPDAVCSPQAEWLIQVTAIPGPPTGIVGPTMVCPNVAFTYEAIGLASGSSVRWLVQNGPGAATVATGNPLNVTWGDTPPFRLTAFQVSLDGLLCTSDSVALDVMRVMPLPISGLDRHCTEVVGYFEVKKIPNITYFWSIEPPDAGALKTGIGANGIEIYWQKPGAANVVVDVCGEISKFPITVSDRAVPQLDLPVGVCQGQVDTAFILGTSTGRLWYDESENLVSDTTYLIAGPGSYVVFVGDSNGCSVGKEFKIEAYPLPNVNLSTADLTGFCDNERTVTLHALADANGSFGYTWFRDGFELVGANTPTYTTDQYGQYTVQVTNANGCTALSSPITVFSDCGNPGGGVCFPGQAPACPPGAVGIDINTTNRCDTMQFVVDAGPLYVPGSASWRIGSSGGPALGIGTGDSYGQSFPNAGAYIVAMTAQLSNGATCSVIDSVRVEVVSAFVVSENCVDSVTAFRDISTFLPGSPIASWTWDFGDPGSGPANTATTQDAGHIYADYTAPFTASLIVTAPSGCTSVATTAVNVNGPTPTPVVGVYPRCTDVASPIPAAASNLISQIVWDFGDPSSGNNNTALGPLVYHQYLLPGNYTMVATSTNIYGCVSQNSFDVSIGANGLSGNVMPAAPAPICQGQSVALQAPPGLFYGWSNGLPGQVLDVSVSGTYVVTVTDAFGCTLVPPAVVVDVLDRPVVAVQALLTNSLGQVVGTVSSPLVICEGEDVYLRASGLGNYTYQWSDGVLGVNNIFSEIRNNPIPTGVHRFTVTATDPLTGCQTESAAFEVIVNPRPSNLSIASSGQCAGVPNVLSYNGPVPPGWTFSWNTGLQGTSMTTEQAGQYYLRVTNALGCSAESNRVQIFPAPPTQTLPDGCLTQCRPDTLCLPNLPDIATWQWYLNGWAIPGATDPNLIPEQSGVYYAELTDFRGCSASSAAVNLTLLDGFGQITGVVWADVNQNGVIDGSDTIVNNIPVVLTSGGTRIDTTASNINGDFVFPNMPAGDYQTILDPRLLPQGWQVVIGRDSVLIEGCNVRVLVSHLIQFTACPILGSTFDAQACPGSSYNYFGTLVPAGSSVDVLLQNDAGCDSVVSVRVATLPVDATIIGLNACQGGNVVYLGTPVAAGTTRDFILQNIWGCDSVVTLVVTADPPLTSDLSVRVCPGNTYTYAGLELPGGQATPVSLSTAAGCDSIVTVRVDFYDQLSAALEVSACSGSAYNYLGTLIPAGTSDIFIFKSAAGCDSVVTVTVDAIAPVSGSLDTVICPGETLVFGGQILTPGTVTDVVLVSQEGCDSVVTVRLLAFPTTVFSTAVEPSCSAAPSGTITVTNLAGGTPPWLFALNNGPFQGADRFAGLSSDTYRIDVEDVYGCITGQNVFVPERLPLSVDLDDALLPCSADAVLLSPRVFGDTTGISWLWPDGSRSPAYVATQPGTVWVEIANICGVVRTEAVVMLEGSVTDRHLVYIPNIFHPEDNLSLNDQFRAFFADDVLVLEHVLEIYDRWGNMVFRTEDPTASWDGRYRGKTMNPGVYGWLIRSRVRYCGQETDVRKSGDITLLR